MALSDDASQLKSDIQSMRQGRLSDTAIISLLQKKGFNARQISDAMNELDSTNIMAGGNMDSQGYEEEFRPIEQPGFPAPAQPIAAPAAIGRDQVEEIAEALIEEKWKELISEWDKLITWKEKAEGRIVAIEQKFADLKDNFDKLHASILERVSDYDRNITDVGTELKALEKVFQKVLPTFTENVNELSRVSADLKRLKR